MCYVRHLRMLPFLPEFDYKNSAIIEPARTAASDVRVNYLVVDSRDRDTSVWPSSSSYAVEFDDPYKDIVSAELVYARLPLASNNVDAWTSTFAVEARNGQSFQVTLATGQYSAQELCEAINAALQPSGVVVSFLASYRKFEFASPAAFSLDLSAANSLKSLLGFRSLAATCQSSLVAATATWTLRAPYPALLEGQTRNYAILSIDNFQNLKSVNNATNNSFAVIDQELVTGSGERREVAKKFFNPPLNVLFNIKVRFQDYAGMPYEFAEKDHYFMLKLECLKNGRRYG